MGESEDLNELDQGQTVTARRLATSQGAHVDPCPPPKCQQWACEHYDWSTDELKNVAWHDESCFISHQVGGWGGVHSLTSGAHGTRMH